MIFAYDLISRFSSSQYQHIFHLCSPNYALFCLNLIRFFNTMLQPHFWGQPFLHSAQLMCITFLTFCRRKGFFFLVATEYQIICFNISRVNLMDKKSDNRVFFIYATITFSTSFDDSHATEHHYISLYRILFSHDSSKRFPFLLFSIHQKVGRKYHGCRRIHTTNLWIIQNMIDDNDSLKWVSEVMGTAIQWLNMVAE